MQSTSSTWRALYANGARLEARATIAGTVYTDITAPVIARALMPEGLSVGNAVSASCSIGLRGAGTIPKAAAVLVEQRLTDGETTSEWLPAGTFYVSRRNYDPVTGRLTLECYDALLKANAVWEPSAGSWPRTMSAVAAELAALIGVNQDSRNAVTGDFAFAEPAEGTTIRDALGRIAAASGGNWIITPAGRLRLVPLVDANADALAARGVLGHMDAGDMALITGVRCVVDEETYLAGDETGAVVTLTGGLPAYAAAVMAMLSGVGWQRFELSAALYDPAAELGDALTAGAGDEITSVLCGETATLGALFRGDVRAPGPEELADEYPYIGAAAKTLTVAKAYAETVSAQAAQALDSALTQMEIFNRLTGNGAAQGLYLVNGQLYVNASYVAAGYLSATRIQGGTLTLGGANDANGVMQVLDDSGNVIGEVNNVGVLSYAANALSRALMRSGAFSLQLYTQDGSGQMTWVDQFSISADSVATNVAAARGQLNLLGRGSVLINNQASYADQAYASVYIQDDAIVITLTDRSDANNSDLVIRLEQGGGITVTQTNIDEGAQTLTYDAKYGDLQVTGRLIPGNGASGTFRTADNKWVTVWDGIVTEIS